MGIAGIEDLDPTPAGLRTWGWRTFALTWLGMVCNPASLAEGAALLSIGLTFAEAAVAHLLGGLILLVVLILNAWPGVQHGIPFPVLARSAFGFHGAHFCTLTRGAVAVLWLSFQLWQGALGLYAALGQALGPSFLEWGRIDETLTLGQLLMYAVNPEPSQPQQGTEPAKQAAAFVESSHPSRCLAPPRPRSLLGFTALHALAVSRGAARFRSLVYCVAPLQARRCGPRPLRACPYRCSHHPQSHAPRGVAAARPRGHRCVGGLALLLRPGARWTSLRSRSDLAPPPPRRDSARSRRELLTASAVPSSAIGGARRRCRRRGGARRAARAVAAACVADRRKFVSRNVVDSRAQRGGPLALRALAARPGAGAGAAATPAPAAAGLPPRRSLAKPPR
jgi:hypothetical protein